MRSLSLKLTLAFIFVAIIGVVLAALFVRQRTQREFDQFVLRRYQADLIGELSDYYQRNGDWSDINAIVVRGPGRFRGHGPGAAPAPVVLIDAGGTVVYGGPFLAPGQQIPQEDLERAIPIDVDGETAGWVLFTDPLNQDFVLVGAPESEFLRNVNQATLFGILGASLVAVLVGVLLARTISRPVREVTAATQIVAGGDLGYQVPVRTKDELGELAASFNQMSADLAQSNEQRRQMTADIAHDLRTPLSVILGYLESLSTGKLEATPETLGIMYAKARHLQHLIDDLRTLALVDAGELTLTRRPVEPELLLEHTALAHMVQAKEKEVSINVEASSGLPQIEVDPERMAQVLGNLVSNALRYTPEGGQIVLSAEAGNKSVLLKVADTGPGIDPEDLPHIFDRFYRSDKSRQQNGESGLGLSIARSIVQAHQGSISVDSVSGKGTTFTIIIPV